MSRSRAGFLSVRPAKASATHRRGFGKGIGSRVWFSMPARCATMKRVMRVLGSSCLAALSVGPAVAQEDSTIRIVERFTLAAEQIAGTGAPAENRMALTLVYFNAGAWSLDAALDATRGAARLLKQCGVVAARLEAVRVDAPRKYQFLDTPVSRELARSLHLAKPTLYFVTDTRQKPAFDAEAIGRANSRTRPELADTIWITRAARNVEIALAHELVHVLTDDGAHVDLPANLMRAQTAPANTHLSNTQCAQLRTVGAKNGLLRTPR
ncbi:MAG TPA: hypothetical protein VGA88_13255 [Burkholderiales bacterium]